MLGHGSGFDSPGWRTLRVAMPRLGQAFHARRREAGLSLAELYVQRATTTRSTGSPSRSSSSTSGARLAHASLPRRRARDRRRRRRHPGDTRRGARPARADGRLPELWDVRNELTARSKAEAAVVTLREEVTELLQDLLRLDTVNPPGNETRAADCLAPLPRAERRRQHPRRADAGSREPRRAARGRRRPPLLLLATRTPCSPTRRVDARSVVGRRRRRRGLGRGALDMKGHVAAAAVAFASLAREGGGPRATSCWL